jgi:hypothetical protein
MSNRADHEHEPERVADEARHADQHASEEYDETVEKLASRHLSSRQTVAGMRQDTETDAPNDERPERAHADQDREGPEEPDLLGNEHKGRDFGRYEKQRADEEHIAG